MEEEKRLFLGFSIQAPWLENYPKDRLIEKENRHLTLAFLGNNSISNMQKHLKAMPLPPFQVAKGGLFTTCLFLPKRHIQAVSWQIQWMSKEPLVESYQKELSLYLQKNDLMPTCKPHFLSHVTIARDPKNLSVWKEAFVPLPMFIQDLHLYESLSHSSYKSLWSYPLHKPFEEFSHTADRAFHIYADSLFELYINAQMALGFSFFEMTPYFSIPTHLQTLDDVIATLNGLLAKMDQDVGCPIKAVSYHGEIKKTPNQILQWEMLIDV